MSIAGSVLIAIRDPAHDPPLLKSLDISGMDANAIAFAIAAKFSVPLGSFELERAGVRYAISTDLQSGSYTMVHILRTITFQLLLI